MPVRGKAEKNVMRGERVGRGLSDAAKGDLAAGKDAWSAAYRAVFASAGMYFKFHRHVFKNG